MEMAEIVKGVSEMGVREFFQSKGLSQRDLSEIEAAISKKFTELLDLTKVFEWIDRKYDGVRKDYACFCALITLGYLNGLERGLKELERRV